MAAKTEKATEWAMGRVTTKGIEILMRGDHNWIEKASAKVNRAAKMRVAFVVDIRCVPAKALAACPVVTLADTEDDEEAA